MFKISDVIFIALLVGLGIVTTYFVSQNMALEVQNKEKIAQIDTLQKQLLKCSPVSNNISIKKIKGRGTAQIEQIIKIQHKDTTHFNSVCDTLSVIKWFTNLKFRDRNFYEKLAKAP